MYSRRQSIGAMPIPAKMATLMHDAKAHAGLCKTWAAFLFSLPDPFMGRASVRKMGLRRLRP